MLERSFSSAESRWTLPSAAFNQAAVEWMTNLRGGYGRVVRLPTFDSEAGNDRSLPRHAQPPTAPRRRTRLRQAR
jgi:hypothetical protein